MLTELNCTPLGIIPFKGSWIEFTTDINNVMYAYIDRKKKLPVNKLYFKVSVLKATKIFSKIFNLDEEIKATKANLKRLLDEN